MTLAPPNEASGRENHMEKILGKEKNYCYDLGGHKKM